MLGWRSWTARVVLVGASLSLVTPAAHAESKNAKIFLVTSSYGVMAGSLTGLASLAFYEDPGNHMKNIAVGASLGLYAGIILGAYMAYVLPDLNKPSKHEPDSFDLEGQLPDPKWVPYVTQGSKGDISGGLALRF